MTSAEDSPPGNGQALALGGAGPGLRLRHDQVTLGSKGAEGFLASLPRHLLELERGF